MAGIECIASESQIGNLFENALRLGIVGFILIETFAGEVS
jgi:hypothetical protein